MVSTGYGPDESGELANTRLCVAGSNETGSDLFYEWLDCARLGLPPLRTCPIFGARQQMAWLYSALASLADLVGSLAEQVNHDYGGRCCAG